ncbi:response regulator [Leptolyngbya sp. 15MV]|nr:response regulator [Leptolyngbya sp. 15MV]
MGGVNNGSTASGGGHVGEKRIFTTGEAAAICKVSQQTIIRCFDSGRLTGFRVPGSKFRRIPREELIRFMKMNNIPLDALESGPRRVLVVDDDPGIVELFKAALSRDGRWEMRSASTGYDAGLLTEQFRPHVVLLDYLLPDINGNLVCQRIKTTPHLRETRIVIVSGVVNQDEVKGLLEAGADHFVKKPFNLPQLLAKMAELAGAESSSAVSSGGSAAGS